MNVENLKKLMSLGLTTEQMAGVIDVLAVELEPLEAMRADAELRRSKDRLRKFRGNAVEIPVQSPTPPIDITTTLVLDKIPPTPKASRFHGTNPRALGTNPRGSQQEPDGFSAFWDAYPKREGNGDRKGAVKAFGPAFGLGLGGPSLTGSCGLLHCWGKFCVKPPAATLVTRGQLALGTLEVIVPCVHLVGASGHVETVVSNLANGFMGHPFGPQVAVEP